MGLRRSRRRGNGSLASQTRTFRPLPQFVGPSCRLVLSLCTELPVNQPVGTGVGNPGPSHGSLAPGGGDGLKPTVERSGTVGDMDAAVR